MNDKYNLIIVLFFIIFQVLLLILPVVETTTFSQIKSNAGGKVQQNRHWNGVTNQFAIQVYLSQKLIGPKPYMWEVLAVLEILQKPAVLCPVSEIM